MTGKNGTRTPYRIVARSELSERYAAAFDGMRMEAKDGETVLTGEIVDQAHLFGVLDRVNGLGLQLMSVQALEDDAHLNADGGRGLQAAHETRGQSRPNPPSVRL
jgi:outer membrane PBP1 activator LpoA protein